MQAGDGTNINLAPGSLKASRADWEANITNGSVWQTASSVIIWPSTFYVIPIFTVVKNYTTRNDAPTTVH